MLGDVVIDGISEIVHVSKRMELKVAVLTVAAAVCAQLHNVLDLVVQAAHGTPPVVGVLLVLPTHWPRNRLKQPLLRLGVLRFLLSLLEVDVLHVLWVLGALLTREQALHGKQLDARVLLP